MRGFLKALFLFALLPRVLIADSFPLFSRPTKTGDYLRALDVRLLAGHVAADRKGNLHVAELGGNEVRTINANGLLEPLAGFGSAILVPGDRAPAILAGSLYVTAMAADPAGNLFIAGGLPLAQTIYRVTTDRMIEVYATSLAWFRISGISADTAGNVYALVATASNRQASLVVKVAPDRTVTPLAQIDADAMAGDEDGNQYTVNATTRQIARIDPAGGVTNLAQVESPSSLAPDRKGNLYISQSNLRIVSRLGTDGSITKVAGGGIAGGAGAQMYGGDGGPATQAGLVQPFGVALDEAGNLYIADGRLRRVDTSGVIRTVAGCGCGGDGVPSFWARVATPIGIVSDGAGNFYFSDQGTHMVRRIGPDGVVTTIAGSGESGFAGDGGPARQALLAAPAGLALDTSGNLYIADERNHRIRKVTPSGIIQTVAGDGVARFAGDGGPALEASLTFPDGVAVDSANSLYIADTSAHRIRKVTVDGIIHTIAGSDLSGLAGDGGPAVQAQLINPRMLAFDKAGDLLMTDTAAHVVRRITPAGLIERVAGTGQPGFSGDGGAAINAQIQAPWGIAVDAAGRVLIGDMSSGAGRIRVVDASGTISTAASGLGNGLASDAAGRIWIAGGGNVTVESGVGLPFSSKPAISDGGVTGAAMPQKGAVAAGEIVSIFGDRLGPMVALGTSVVSGVVSTSLGGTRVLIDGIPAPLLYVQASQINAVVPFEVAGKPIVQVVVEVAGLASNPVTLGVVRAAPQLFVGGSFMGNFQPAAALNQMGGGNGPGSPADAGSIVSLVGTGVGAMNPRQPDGQVTGATLPVPELPVRVSIAARSLEVPYAGAAPGFVAGALQVNVRLPDDLATGYYALELRVGDTISGSALVFTRARQ